jgi:hypothetical protein
MKNDREKATLLKQTKIAPALAIDNILCVKALCSSVMTSSISSTYNFAKKTKER